jgi:hypothetical protein
MIWKALRYSALLVGATAALLWAPSAAQAAAGEGLSLLSSANAITVTAGEGEDTAETHLALFNENPTHTRLEARFEASSSASVKVVSVIPERLPAEEVTRVAVVFEGLESLREPVSGELVISGGPDPIAQSVEVKPAPQPTAPWTLLILFVPLFGAIFVALMVVGNMPGDNLAPLKYSAPGAKWEAKSWATTLTAAGALLGTVLGGVTFPSYPEQISKESLVNLNLLFGALVVVGPFLFQALRRRTVDEKDRKAERFGTNLTLLLTSAVTLWAVFGQLAAFSLLTWELISTEWLAAVIVAVLVLLALGAARYFFLTMSEAVIRNWSTEEEAAKRRTVKRREKHALERENAILTPIRRVTFDFPREEADVLQESPPASAEIRLAHIASDPEAAEEPRPESFALL